MSPLLGAARAKDVVAAVWDLQNLPAAGTLAQLVAR